MPSSFTLTSPETEFDSNRPIAAPLAGDIGSVMSALLDGVSAHPIIAPAEWAGELAESKAANDAKMRRRLADDPQPMRFYNALGAIRSVLQSNPDVYVVNEGANALDLARNVIDIQMPRHRLDTGTWGVMGIGMGYAIAAAVETGKPVVAIEGDSAFGFSGTEIETICRYRLPVTVVILNNGGVYRGDEVTTGHDPAPTVLNAHARHELIAEAFGGKGYHVTAPSELQQALTEAIASNGPSIIDCELDPAAGVESGHLASLNPTSAATSTSPPVSADG
jgi:oxalyl-CoA decarboxylase